MDHGEETPEEDLEEAAEEDQQAQGASTSQGEAQGRQAQGEAQGEAQGRQAKIVATSQGEALIVEALDRAAARGGEEGGPWRVAVEECESFSPSG